MDKILIADKKGSARKSLEKIIEQLGYETHTVDDGHMLIRQALKEHYHLIFSDIDLAGKSGIETTHIIRNDFPGTLKEIPLIALSCDKNPAFVNKILQEGFDGCLSKPYTIRSVKDC